MSPPGDKHTFAILGFSQNTSSLVSATAMDRTSQRRFRGCRHMSVAAHSERRNLSSLLRWKVCHHRALDAVTVVAAKLRLRPRWLRCLLNDGTAGRERIVVQAHRRSLADAERDELAGRFASKTNRKITNGLCVGVLRRDASDDVWKQVQEDVDVR